MKNKKQKKEKSTETQLLKFSGNNTYNNDVTVDYRKQTIKFNPVKLTGKFHLLFVFLSQLFLTNVIIFTLSVGIPLTVYYSIMYPNYDQSFFIFIIILLGALIGIINCVIYTGLYNYSVLYQRWVFPKQNAIMIKLITRLMSLGLSKVGKKREINELKAKRKGGETRV